MIRFNSVNPELFSVNSGEFSGSEKERAYIVTCGRALMMDRNGRDTNALRVLEKRGAEYTPMMADTGENSYAETNRNLQKRMMLFAAKMACSNTGEVAPADYGEFQRRQRHFMSDRTFLKVLSGVIRDVVAPILPLTISNGLDWMAETVSVPFGQTYELDVMSNDVIAFEDDSWGASRSKPANSLYSYPITLNPTLRTAKVSIKWYQLVGNDADLGRFFNSIAAGMYSKIVALWNKALVSATGNTFFMPSNLQFTNTSANWVTAAQRLSMVNGAQYSSVVGIGMPSALSKVLPSGIVNGSSVNLDAALSTMLGLDYTRYGFMGEYMGVRLHPITGSVVPGTQNTSMTNIVPENKVWLMSAAGYKPVYIGFEEGGEITLELSPSETADMTIDILTSICVDAKPVMASKMAVITV